VVGPAGYGDEGKWVWMARISGEARTRLIQEGYMNAATAWTDETAFGSSNSQTGRWQWNDQGESCTVYELMNYAEVQYCNEMTTALSAQGYTFTPDATTTQPTYFTTAYFGGLETSPFQYGGLVPIVAIYKIDWQAYYAATGRTG
ncbi:hypothetical protein MUP42_02735, partial [Candidatus Bathyarchaeota archaeon]|nr:hypothetical protein [Candidatus Bathyarchaeota archaeon]